MSTEQQRFESWCIVELMGHVTLTGFVRETEIGGGKLFQIEVPASNGAQKFTTFFGSSSVYKLTPVDRATVIAICTRKAQQPFTSWELQQAFSDMIAVHKDKLRDQVRDELRRELEHKPDSDAVHSAIVDDDRDDDDTDDYDRDDDDAIRSML
jgi:hypothetical protein